jgi:glycosyltransferase involved in cell wall biosynthesis
VYCSDSGIGHICLSLCQHMQAPGFNVHLTVPATEPQDRRDFVRDVVPFRLRALSCRKPLHGLRHWCTERQYVRQLRAGDVAYIWPGASTWVYEQVKARGHTLVMERINCHRATARRILDDAYDRLGWAAMHGISDEHTAEEQYKLELADYVLCPSPLVLQSMADAGISRRKLLSASYGWDPRRFRGEHRLVDRSDGLTVIFVGLACVRKGIHLLLKAWDRARIKGRLLIVGDLASDIASGCADQLNRPDVNVVPYVDDVAAAYRSAHLFAFPTLEEGSPLVSYEAMAGGLAIVTSPMGAGEVIRDGQEGIVLDPYAEDAWVNALKKLAANQELRESLGRNARSRVEAYTWLHVGRHRRVILSKAWESDAPHRAKAVAIG